MKAIRTGLSVLVVVLLTAGYLGSQVFAFGGNAAVWAKMMDQPAIVWSALALLAASVALAIVQDREESG